MRRPLGAIDGVAQTTPRRRPTCSPTLRHERVLEELQSHVWSASSFETWIGCPVRWFVERLLRPGAIEPDGEPLARGGLAHAVLKDTLEALRRETGVGACAPADARNARELLERAFAENEAGVPPFGRSRAPARALRRLRSDLGRYLDHAAETDSQLEPSALELGFGFAAERSSEARRARCRHSSSGAGSGCGAESTAWTSARRARRSSTTTRRASPRRRPSGSARATCRSPCTCARLRICSACQPPEASTSRSPVQTCGARGLLDGDSAVELDCVRGDVREHEEVRELLEEALAAARQAAAQAGAGALEARPHSCAYNGGCMYPTICRCESSMSRAASHRRRSRLLERGLDRRAAAAAVARRAEPLLLSAGAGSGKTSVLVERFVRAVREDQLAPGRSSRSRSPTARRASCASGCGRVSWSWANARPHATPRPRSWAPSTASAHVCCARIRCSPSSIRTSRSSTRRVAGRLRERAFALALRAFSGAWAPRGGAWICSLPTAWTVFGR